MGPASGVQIGLDNSDRNNRSGDLPLGDLGILLCEGEVHIEGKIVSNLLIN